MRGRVNQGSCHGAMAADRLRRGAVVLGLLLVLAASRGAVPVAADTTPSPTFTLLESAAGIMPGQPVRVRLQWRLSDLAEPDPTPSAEVAGALLQWDAMAYTETGVAWEGKLIPLQPGDLSGRVTCTANLPLLPAELPTGAVFPAPSRYLAHLYSPCRSRRLAPTLALPPIAVAPWPQAPPNLPPFCGLLGVWSATLTTARAPVAMREPLTLDLRLKGHGSATLFQPPTLSHPDLDVLKPTVDRGPDGDLLHVRWTVIPTRIPMEPVRLSFSTLDQAHYTGHRLELALCVLPDPPPQAGAALPPPVILRFHPLPRSPAPPAGGLLAGLNAAGLGALAGLLLAAAARRRDRQRGPEGLRKAALKRLRRAPLTHADELPAIHCDLRVWRGLPAGASAAEIEAALRSTHPDLADELRDLETRRFSASAAADPRRLAALLRQLRCLGVLAFLGCQARAALPPEAALPQIAAEAFRQRDFAQACTALTRLRQPGRESPELLMNLANACWFSGRRIEALALYERAVRYSPRRQDSRDGLAWLRTQLPTPDAAAAATWTHPIRDRLRPDEWVFLAGLLIGLSSLVGGLLRWCRRPTWPALASGAVTAGVCLWFAAAQYTGTYRVGATARLTQAIPLRAAPAAVAEELTPVLPPGTVVTPTAVTAHWVRVRTATAEGWVPETGCILVW